MVLFACLFASQSALLVLSPTLVEMAGDFGVSTATAGQLRSVSGAAGGATALVLATLDRRAALRELLSAGAALVAAAVAVSAAAPSFAVLAAAQAVLGVGIGLLVAVGIAAAGEWSAPAERSNVLAWAIAGMPASWVAGMPLAAVVGGLGWRATWLAVAGAAAVVALALVRTRPPDPPSRRTAAAAGAWRRPAVARFTAAELLANAAWAAVLTYSGTLLLTSYAISPAAVAFGLGMVAIAMLPGTFGARRHASRVTPALLPALTLAQAAAVLALCAVRPAPGVTVALLAAMGFVNGRRSMVAGAVGMDSAPDDRVAAMAMRAAANQLGYLLGASAGGLAIALGGFLGLGLTLASLFAVAAVIHLPSPALITLRPQGGP